MIKVLELFAGIGACSKALTNLGIEHEIVDAVEIDKYAVASFNAIHGTNFEPQDVCEWDKNIECDLIMHGSPCQDFSIAGKQAGGDKDSGTRSSLMYETLRIVEKLKPKYAIWENVKNLLSQKHRHNFDAYLEAMEKLGYTNHYQVLNAKDYGIPQNRERVFTVSILRGGEFKFPPRRPLTRRLKDVLEDNVDEKYYLPDEKAKNIKFSDTSKTVRAGGRGSFDKHSLDIVEVENDNYIQDPLIIASRGRSNGDWYSSEHYQKFEPRRDGLTNTISHVQKDNYVAIRTANSKGYDLAKDGDGIDLGYPESKTRRGRVGHGVCKTLPTSDSQGVLDGFRIRKLTPKECWRLMGFDDSDFDKASKVNSNTQLYKQAGNSIVVPVLEAILKELLCK